nr:2C [hepatovirus B1]
AHDWLRDLTSGITVFKALKDAVLWIAKKVKEFYEKHCGKHAQILKMISEYKDQIESLLTESDEFCAKPIQDVEKNEQYLRGLDLVKSLRTVTNLLSFDSSLVKYASPIRDAISRVHNKLKTMGAINQNMVTRAEPVVCFLTGKRGGGKSLTSMALATKICVKYGVDPKKNIYTKPVSSDFWDGYSNQLVCIMDDIGQCTDDEDWSDFCQLVSGCPLRLNMASLEEKGKHFSSPFIICTSNQEDPCPKTVYVKDAISRRLHYKIKVSPKDYYSKNGMLNVELAKSDGMIKNMDCVNLNFNDCNITLENLVDSMVSTLKIKQKNMDDFMELWSQ